MEYIALGIGFTQSEYADILTLWEKYNIDMQLVSSIEEALLLMEKRIYVCVALHSRILDYQMLIEGMRNHKSIPVLIITPGNLAQNHAEKIVQYICDMNADSGHSITEHKDAIADCLNTSPNTEQDLTIITDKNFYFCLEQRFVQVCGVEIALAPKEFDALYLLIRNRKRVLTFDMISLQVCREECIDNSPKAINNLVSRLRQKLKVSVNAPDYIKSVHGVGYKFDATS